MDFTSIVAIVEARRRLDSSLKRSMIEVRDRYNGDIVLPLIDVEGEPTLKSPSPQLIADAIDNAAMRAASTRPAIHVPALRPEKFQGVGSRAYSDIRRKALYAVWHRSAFSLICRKAYRQLAGYGEMAMVVVPDYEAGMPRIETRDALTAYPEPKAAEDISPPGNVGFVYGRSASWISDRYGARNPEVGKIVEGAEELRSMLWDLVEWIDEDHIVLGLIGPRDTDGYRRLSGNSMNPTPIELSRGPNRAGLVPAVVGKQITLDRVAATISRVVGNADLMDRLLALDILAQEKAIFPDRFLIAEDGRSPRILNAGGWQDGRTGEMNLLDGVRQIGEVRGDVSPQTGQLIDRLERNIRVSSGNPSLFGGELSGSLRSGQTVNALGSFAIDPRVQEMQEIMGYNLGLLNEAIVATYQGCFAGKKLTLFSGWATDRGHVVVDVDRNMETRENVVTYAFPGADVNAVTVATGQLVGTRLMSRQTGRSIHPMIDDPAFEANSVMEETLTDAILQSTLSQAQSGALPLIDASRILQLLREGDTIDMAVQKSSAEAQARQAQQAPPPGPDQATAPGAQPGLALPGQGVEQAPTPQGGTIPPPGRSVDDLRQLVNGLVSPVTRARSI